MKANSMRKKPIITIASQPAQVHSLSQEGRGIATVLGKKTFIEGALPLETVKYCVLKKRANYDEALSIEVLKASPERTTPSCRHFGLCGGCSMQHLEVSAQVAWKQKILLEQLAHIGQVQPETLIPALLASAWEYRHKARLGVRYMKQHHKVIIGFRKKFRGHLTDLDLCPVLHPQVGKRLPALAILIANLEAQEQIPQIEVAVGDDQAALIFRHLIPLSLSDRAKLRDFGLEHQLHIYLQPNPPESVSLLWPENQASRLHYRLPDFQMEFRFHPLDFTQIHLEMNRLMVKQAVDLLDPQAHETVLDLFCGIGNFSLPLARYAKKVIGIEGNKTMIERAYENAAHNTLANLEFHVANLFEPSIQESWFHQTYEKILLDPPRAGAKEIIEHFSRFAPHRLVYVSCHPATLARDAYLLVHQQGYRLKQLGIINMFPHTSHVEAMAVFERH